MELQPGSSILVAVCAMHGCGCNGDGASGRTTAPGEKWPIEACRPSNEALLARDWIATSTPRGIFNGKREFVSFDECCFWLGCNADAERVGLLAIIDAGQDFDNADAWRRLAELQAGEPEERIISSICRRCSALCRSAISSRLNGRRNARRRSKSDAGARLRQNAG